MKRIVFDLTKTQPQLSHNSKYHGGGKYGVEVFKKLAEIASDKIIAYYNDEQYINNEVLEIIKTYSIPVFKTKNLTILELARKEDCMIYTPIVDRCYFKDSSLQIFTTLHDIRGLVLPNDKYMFSYRLDVNRKERIIRFLESCAAPLFAKYKYLRVLQKYHFFINSKQLQFITVSNYSKETILSRFPQIKKDIKVFYSPSTISQEEVSKNPIQKGKYWLIVSGNRWVKNSIRALIAFDHLFSRHPELEGNVVVTGLKSLNYIKINIVNTSRFICVGYISESDLKSYYHYAYALIYPTLSEGFGYPPLEAMYEGCPVIASSVASIPEICGDAVLYFNPYSISEIEDRIIQFEDELVRNQYAIKGKERQSVIEEKQNKDLCAFCSYLLSCLDSSDNL